MRLREPLSRDLAGKFGAREPVVVAVDSTGLKITKRVTGLGKKHGYDGKDSQRRGWLKVHIAVDAVTKKLLSVEVTD